MFKKLFIFSISSSLLLSIPVIANGPQNHHEALLASHHDHHHHHHHDKEKEIRKEKLEEAKQKSTSEKVVGGLLQFVNKTAGLWALAASFALEYYCGPFIVFKHGSSDARFAGQVFEGFISFVALWKTLHAGTAAAMAQTDNKPLKK